MNRLRKIGAALAVAGMLATYVPSGLVLAQVNPNSPIEVSVDILLQVDANPPKRQENATYEIVDEAGNVVYRHESDAQASEAPKLTAGKYRLRLYDGQGFKRADKVLKAQKVETSIPKRSEQDIAANKQLQEQSDKGSLKTDDQGQAYYEVAFEVKAGPDLESADHQKMVSKLAVTLSDQEGAGSAPQAPAQSSSQAPEVKRNLTVKVLDQAQEIVPGATVTVEGQTAVTDENGDAHFKDLTPGTVHYAVTQLPAGYEGTPSGEAELPTDTDHSITLQVAKKAEPQVTKRDLTVKVLDQEQKTVAGVTVTVEDQSAVTDENGDAHFKGLTPGTVHYAVTQLPEGYEGTPSGEAELPADTDHSITLQVAKKAAASSEAPAAKRDLTVKVLDQEQKLVPGVTVKVEEQTAVTDENGDAHFKGLTPGKVHYAVTDLPDGYEGTPSGDAELPSDTDHSITLQVTKKAENPAVPAAKRDLTVKILDQDQKIVAGVTVTVEDQTAVTDENGDAHFKGLTPGMVRYAVTKLPDGYEGTPSGEAELLTDTDHSITLQVTRKDQASSSSSSSSQAEKRDLTVKILDNAGKEVPGVSVKIGDQVQVTNEYGQAVFKGLTPGTFHYEIVNLPENYTGAQAGDAELPADTDHSITLTVQRQQAVANVTVKVMDDNNQSVPGVTVYLGELEGQTDDQGNILFEALEAGKYTYGIKEVPEAYQAETGAQTLDVAPGADLHPILKVSRKAQVASLELNVVNVAGQAVADVTLAVGNQQLKTDAQGKVTFTNLKAGDYDYYVVAVPEPYQLDQTKIKLTLANGQTAKRTIQLAEKPAASSSSSASSDKVTATKTSGVERKDGNLPSTGEQVMAWLTPLALALLALGGAILFFRRRKNQASTDASQDEDHEA
ncbi:SpaA isopeptide-forming pilin-related protein [Abiotrophia defectiva]|uniref:SpaA isopeptide-forming pilin-related protein n=1 Tax=Abiotrophia defectiva TaxID=46125 RepID=UPI0028D51132|nr:SpaA isopeptide-forming pilin-related protein [Abiotrophia defectiva]